MTDDTPVLGGAAKPRKERTRLDEQMQALLDLSAEFQSDLRDLMNTLRKDPSKAAEAKKHLGNLGGLMKFALEQDEKLHEFENERTGPAGQFALDLDRARLAIGERLARLGDARGTSGVSG